MERPRYGERVSVLAVKAKTVTVPVASGEVPDFVFDDHQLHVVGVSGSINEESPVELYKLSNRHGRSYELVVRGMEEIGAWGDQHGILFTAFSVKGNTLGNPYIYENRAMPLNFDTHGLQDAVLLERTVRASEVLRELGIEAEATTRIIEPLELPHLGKLRSIPNFKDSLVKHTMTRKAKNSTQIFLARYMPFLLDSAGREELARIRGFAKASEYRFSVRAMQVPERMWDLGEQPTRGALLQVIGRAFGYANFYERLKSEENPEYEADYFDIEKMDDIYRFFGTYVPTKVGRYFARMHMNGITHGFPHQGNISTVGSIYDLDSVSGEVLGMGDEVAPMDYFEDIDQLIKGSSILKLRGFYEVLGIDRVQADLLNQKYVHTLMTNYLGGIDPDKISLQHSAGLIGELKMLIDHEYFNAPILEWMDNLINNSAPGVNIEYDRLFYSMLASYEKECTTTLPDGRFKSVKTLAVFIDTSITEFVLERHGTSFQNPLVRDLFALRISSTLQAWTRESVIVDEMMKRITRIRRTGNSNLDPQSTLAGGL